ncbi:MAG: hypothetical protein HYV32_05545 [Candidatus Kerfeldbacteria bacterium]|nr:hypothetical protein [Candidatus Kerfeldbacteria bacterium]
MSELPTRRERNKAGQSAVAFEQAIRQIPACDPERLQQGIVEADQTILCELDLLGQQLTQSNPEAEATWALKKSLLRRVIILDQLLAEYSRTQTGNAKNKAYEQQLKTLLISLKQILDMPLPLSSEGGDPIQHHLWEETLLDSLATVGFSDSAPAAVMEFFGQHIVPKRTEARVRRFHALIHVDTKNIQAVVQQLSEVLQAIRYVFLENKNALKQTEENMIADRQECHALLNAAIRDYYYPLLKESIQNLESTNIPETVPGLQQVCTVRDALAQVTHDGEDHEQVADSAYRVVVLHTNKVSKNSTTQNALTVSDVLARQDAEMSKKGYQPIAVDVARIRNVASSARAEYLHRGCGVSGLQEFVRHTVDFLGLVVEQAHIQVFFNPDFLNQRTAEKLLKEVKRIADINQTIEAIPGIPVQQSGLVIGQEPNGDKNITQVNGTFWAANMNGKKRVLKPGIVRPESLSDVVATTKRGRDAIQRGGAVDIALMDAMLVNSGYTVDSAVRDDASVILYALWEKYSDIFFSLIKTVLLNEQPPQEATLQSLNPR